MTAITETKEKASPVGQPDEELIDTLVAISVVAKRLAARLRASRDGCDGSEKKTDGDK